MANIPKGPGQAEVSGDLRDARDPQPTGTYKDPQSGAILTVTMGAGADALVRMGWELQPAGAPISKPAKSTDAAVDDADAVEDEQDNAQGHKSEVVDGAVGVPAGDPEKLKNKR